MCDSGPLRVKLRSAVDNIIMMVVSTQYGGTIMDERRAGLCSLTSQCDLARGNCISSSTAKQGRLGHCEIWQAIVWQLLRSFYWQLQTAVYQSLAAPSVWTTHLSLMVGVTGREMVSTLLCFWLDGTGWRWSPLTSRWIAKKIATLHIGCS